MNPKLICVVSAGHSGSTLLDLVCGTIPGGFSLGECTYFPWQLSRREPGGPTASKQKVCSCGAGFHECEFWLHVVKKLSDAVDFDVATDPMRFRMNLLQNERFHTVGLSRDRVVRGLSTLAHSHPWIYPISWPIERSLRSAIANNWLFFDIVAEVSGSRFLVDSSKSALRAKLLQKQRPEDVSILVLFRDIRGVAHSRAKLGQDPVGAAQGWVRQYNRMYDVLRRIELDKLICVRYEHLVTDPSAERRRIAGFLGIDIPADPVVIDTNLCHTVAGNQIRSQGPLTIRADVAWASALEDQVVSRIEEVRRQLNPAWDAMLEQSKASRESPN